MNKKLETIVLGGGCFWCLEASYQIINGVTKVVPGYSGGDFKNPSYQDLHRTETGHTEVVKVSFDTSVISLDDVLDIFWTIHDPTTLNRQGADVGPEYRSIILYSNNEQKNTAEQSIKRTQKLWDKPIVTELKQLDKFYEAEEIHHNYFKKNSSQAYCQIVINPKLEKLREKFSEKLKS